MIRILDKDVCSNKFHGIQLFLFSGSLMNVGGSFQFNVKKINFIELPFTFKNIIIFYLNLKPFIVNRYEVCQWQACSDGA